MDVVISREAGMARNKLIGLMVSLSLVGCSKQVASYTRSAGSVALSAEGDKVYAVDSDNGTLLIASAVDGKLLNTVKVGTNPSRVVVGSDGRVFVSNRGDRTVSVVDVVQLKETAKISTGVEPVGLSFTTSTGHAASWTIALDTLPRTASASAVRPREPTTITSAWRERARVRICSAASPSRISDSLLTPVCAARPLASSTT